MLRIHLQIILQIYLCTKFGGKSVEIQLKEEKVTYFV
jgi:hypothetical protein